MGWAGAGGFTTSCQQMYVSFDASAEATAAHELFHCFQDIAGIAGFPTTLGTWLNLLMTFWCSKVDD